MSIQSHTLCDDDAAAAAAAATTAAAFSARSRLSNKIQIVKRRKKNN
jgi:hypothetical protein